MQQPVNSSAASTRRGGRSRLDRGFTLIELLLVMVITGVLASIAAPSLSRFAGSLQLTSATNALLSSIHLARAEAIKRNGRVVLCKSFDGIVCAPAGGWEQGWIVFHDLSDNGQRESTEPLVLRQQALSETLRVTGNATVSNYISFVATGGTKLLDGGFQAGTVTLCRASASSGSDSRQIIVNAAGRPRVRRGTVPICG